ncbi:hypothetical protein GWJ21_15240 [Bacillus coagulans]|uniref:NAD(P)/FAD-dependent oxidoreductase n=1 Tax=Heyndrickxia coagulans TaxID=1398 RepID=UPI00137832AD|nr:NAD(P)/FAD-dependent oxidoreductase [Heyndrickxia coagulans]NCG69206.1 hypothetical protein [Heyndrickxia coagulans]
MRDPDFDVVIVGAGPAGLYSSIVLQRGIPTQADSEKFKICILEKGMIGGLTKYAFIQISKKWAFSGPSVIAAFLEETKLLNIQINEGEEVKSIKPINKEGYLEIVTDKNTYISKYVIIASGIVTYPDAMLSKKVTIGLHTPIHMAEEAKGHGWKKLIVYGNNDNSLINLKGALDKLEIFEDVLVYNHEKNQQEKQEMVEGLLISKALFDLYDGVIIDYNSYKVQNGSVNKIDIPNLVTQNGFILTDAFGKTNISNIYAAGTVSNIITGIPISLSSAQITALSVGRNLRKELISEPSGRFPWFPREVNWEESWLPYLKLRGSESFDFDVKFHTKEN